MKENIDFVICKICGTKKRTLAMHVNRIHGLKGWQYKRRYKSRISCVNKEKITANTCLKKYGFKCQFPFHTQKNQMQTKETKLKFSKSMKERYGVSWAQQSSDIRKKTVQTNLLKFGKNTPAQNKDILKKMQKTTKKRWGALNIMQSPKGLDLWKRGLANTRINPTSLEAIIIKWHISNLQYTGNRKAWITFKNHKHKNPDFIVKDKKMAIEAFGNYWHTKKEAIQLRKLYGQLGWKILILWENDVIKNPIKSKNRVVHFINRFRDYDFSK